MDPIRIPRIMIYWKPEGRKKRGRPRRTWKDGIYTAMNGRDLRMGEWNNRRQRKSEGVVRRFKTVQYIYIYIYIYIYMIQIKQPTRCNSFTSLLLDV
jgi:hypothetical protein